MSPTRTRGRSTEDAVIVITETAGTVEVAEGAEEEAVMEVEDEVDLDGLKSS